jgi:hypothetical protein
MSGNPLDTLSSWVESAVRYLDRLQAAADTLRSDVDGAGLRAVRSWGQVQTGGGGPTILSGTGDFSVAQDTSKVTITLDVGFEGQGDWVPWAWSLSTTAAHFPVVSNVGSGDAFEIRRYNAGVLLEDPTAVTIRYGFAVVGDR